VASIHNISILEWDSNFFGQKMGKIGFDPADEASCLSETAWRRTIETARKQQFQFLFCEFDAAQKRLAHILCNIGGSLGDVLLTLECEPREVEMRQSRVVPACSDDLPAIIEIARDSFEQSRFFHDPRFDRIKVSQIYPQWVRDSFEKTEHFFVIKEQYAVRAFISVAVDRTASVLTIRLLAVDHAMQGKGMGQELIDWVIGYAWNQQIRRIVVGTQVGNYPAIRLYEKNRFRIAGAKYRFHIWLDHAEQARKGHIIP
jgi:dTDP-4-amino-4,6-dideoxy-D-galactose acyltransferase